MVFKHGQIWSKFSNTVKCGQKWSSIMFKHVQIWWKSNILPYFTMCFIAIHTQADDAIKENWSTWSNMVKHGQTWSNMVKHGQTWSSHRFLCSNICSTCSNMVKHGLQFPNVLTWSIMVTNDLQTWSNIVKVVKHNRYGLSLSNWLELDVYCFVSLCLSMFAHVWSCSKNMFNHDWTCLNMFGNYVWPSSNMVNHS